MTLKSNRKTITKEEYFQLSAYQNIYNQIMILLENLELDALEITQEIDPKDSFDRYLLGGLTSDLLNSNDKGAINDVLKLLGITIEHPKPENKKDVGKVGKKKYKSGSWKGKKSVNVDFDESDEMKKYLAEHSNKLLFTGDIISFNESNGDDCNINSDLFDNVNVDESGAAG